VGSGDEMKEVPEGNGKRINLLIEVVKLIVVAVTVVLSIYAYIGDVKATVGVHTVQIDNLSKKMDESCKKVDKMDETRQTEYKEILDKIDELKELIYKQQSKK
jgi:hypothetical protein